MRPDLFSVVAHTNAHTSAQSFHGQCDQLVVTQPVGVADDVCTRFIHPEYHQQSLSFGEGIAVEKIAHAVSHQGQVACMAAEFDLLPLH